LLGAFLLGAYQEILGDLHNLFGDTHEVHVSLTADNQVVLDSILRGDTVSDVLDYVDYKDRDLVSRLQESVETAVRCGLIDNQQAGRIVRVYEEGLRGYTYLEESPENVGYCESRLRAASPAL
jgi:arginine decarboxylase